MPHVSWQCQMGTSRSFLAGDVLGLVGGTNADGCLRRSRGLVPTPLCLHPYQYLSGFHGGAGNLDAQTDAAVAERVATTHGTTRQPLLAYQRLGAHRL